jgi:DMSO/TMAO reductase YedYZ molybdopterin-dependent catalytic subunit
MVLPATAIAAGEAKGAGARLLYRQRQPDNLEADFSALTDRVTPVESFYVRSHFPVPSGRAESWVIQVEGAVERPLELPVSELRGMRQQTVMATLECAGNSRVFLSPAAAGVQWELGAVGNAEWSGVSLSEVLNKAGVKAGAVEVLLEGADEGVLRNDPKPEGAVPFGRSLPLKKAMRPEVLLATGMNGSALTPAHGYPVRAVVPGYYGMASIKWVKRIVVLTEPFEGYFQTVDYGYWAKLGGAPVRKPLYDMAVKSAIAKPSVDEVVPSGARYLVQGWAWTGDADVTNVEFSPDGGRSWIPASLEGEPQRFVWRRWTLDWTVPSEGGERILMSRATDSLGRVQASAHDPAYGNYVIHHTLPIRVQVV